LEGGERRRERQECLGGIVSFIPLFSLCQRREGLCGLLPPPLPPPLYFEIRGGEEGKKGEGFLRETNLREKCGENRGKE